MHLVLLAVIHQVINQKESKQVLVYETTCLTEQSVEVSVFAWQSDDDCVQSFLGPPLQTIQPGLIYFLWSLELAQNAPHVTSPSEEEQSD